MVITYHYCQVQFKHSTAMSQGKADVRSGSPGYERGKPLISLQAFDKGRKMSSQYSC